MRQCRQDRRASLAGSGIAPQPKDQGAQQQVCLRLYPRLTLCCDPCSRSCGSRNPDLTLNTRSAASIAGFQDLATGISEVSWIFSRKAIGKFRSGAGSVSHLDRRENLGFGRVTLIQLQCATCHHMSGTKNEICNHSSAPSLPRLATTRNCGSGILWQVR